MKQKTKHLLGLLLTTVMCATICPHVHTEECGENGINCTHVHTEECYDNTDTTQPNGLGIENPPA